MGGWSGWSRRSWERGLEPSPWSCQEELALPRTCCDLRLQPERQEHLRVRPPGLWGLSWRPRKQTAAVWSCNSPVASLWPLLWPRCGLTCGLAVSSPVTSPVAGLLGGAPTSGPKTSVGGCSCPSGSLLTGSLIPSAQAAQLLSLGLGWSIQGYQARADWDTHKGRDMWVSLIA